MKIAPNLFCAEWDCAKADTRLGNLLIFMKEIDVLAHQKGVEMVKLRVIGASDTQKRWMEVLFPCAATRCKVSWPAAVTTPDPGYDDASDVWPYNHDLPTSSWAGSTRWLQKAHMHGLDWPDFLNPYALPANCQHIAWSQAIAVHLKNVPGDVQSAANFEAWKSLFETAAKNSPEVTFLLIGDDAILHDLLDMENVVKAGRSLPDYFAVLAHAAAFFGMSSGFCNYAILARKPYRIWKHEGHHSEEMKHELTTDRGFSFAGNNQKFIIGADDEASLIEEFQDYLCEGEKER